jgi:hypothetical protein
MNEKKSELRLKNALDCLKDMHDTWKNKGCFDCMSDYTKTYSVSVYFGLALLHEKIIKKIGTGRNTIYEWIAVNEPTEQMVQRIFERISIIGRNYSKNKSSNVDIPISIDENLSTAIKGPISVNADDWFDAYGMLSKGKYSEKERRELAKEFARWKVGLKKII